jgi:hypothetical protein
MRTHIAVYIRHGRAIFNTHNGVLKIEKLTKIELG